MRRHEYRRRVRIKAWSRRLDVVIQAVVIVALVLMMGAGS